MKSLSILNPSTTLPSIQPISEPNQSKSPVLASTCEERLRERGILDAACAANCQPWQLQRHPDQP
ncbi:MAG: hypothetical protein ABI700_09955 [Chloroflexota bacterium]